MTAIVMERHHCTLMEHLLRRGCNFSQAEVLDVAVQLAEGVNHLLSHGVVGAIFVLFLWVFLVLSAFTTEKMLVFFCADRP